jgi:hypothetical protein
MTATALAAAEILREISAGHEDAAEALATVSGLGDMDAAALDALCARFGTEP